MKNKQRYLRIWNIGSNLMVVLLVLVAILFVGVRLFGLTPYIVMSGSMEPDFPVGSLIYVQEMDPEAVEVGDPITFVLNEELQVATHRVVASDPESQTFRTKGDANDVIDGRPVHYNNLLGTPVFMIPFLGYVANFMTQPPGVYLAVAILISLVVLFFLGSWLEKHLDEPQETPSV